MIMANYVTRMKEYLRICPSYVEDISKVGSWIVDGHNRKRQRSDTGAVIGLRGGEKTGYAWFISTFKTSLGRDDKISGHGIVQERALFESRLKMKVGLHGLIK